MPEMRREVIVLILDALKAGYRNLKFWNLLREKTSISVADAGIGLQAYLPRKKPEFSQKNLLDPQYDVMIIVPVYNAEKYLDQCIDSVLDQKTKYTYQAVFINDGSTDDSEAILKRRVETPHLAVSQKNHGVSVSRNCVLKHITGRYVMFLDSDDYLSNDAIEAFVSAADKFNADITEGGHVYFDQHRVLDINKHSEEITKIDKRELYGYPWGKVIKSQRLNDFCFPEGYLFEDTVMATLLHPSCQCTISVPTIAYYYRDNQKGITHGSKVRKEAVDTFWITKYCLEERLRRGQTLDHTDYERYLTAAWRNYERTKALPCEIQEWIFVLTCDLFEKCLPFCYEGKQRRMFMLEKALHHKSFAAFRFVAERWDVL